MNLSRILKSVFGMHRPTSNRRLNSRDGQSCRKKLQVEPLEDRTLLSSGIVTLSVGGASDRAFASFVGANDEITVVGGARASGEGENYLVARYESHGILDSSFSDDGVATLDLNKFGSERARAVAPYLNTGKTIVAGSLQEGRDYTKGDISLVRYLADGSLDSSFGSGKGNQAGRVTLDLGGSDSVWDVLVLPDGGIIAAGQSNMSGATHFTLTRFTASGQLDTSFGTDGIVQTVMGSNHDVISSVILHQGKILAAGTANDDVGGGEFALARYNLDGTLDTSFGGGTGIVVSDYLYDGYGNTVAIDSNDNILIAGNGGSPGVGWDFAVARYTANGTLDTTFGTNGLATMDLWYDQIHDLAVQPDGKIVAVGESWPVTGWEDAQWAVMRFDSNGMPDANFGTNGIVVTPIYNSNIVRSVALQSDGRIVASGYATAFNPDGSSTASVAIVRYNTDGSLDTTFGEPLPGITVTPTSGLQTSEDGGTASFTIVLNTQPENDVFITVVSLDESEGIVSITQLHFTTANWNMPQTVVITGVDDSDKDGDQTYAIRLTVSSADSNYGELNVDDLFVTNQDNEKGGKPPKN